MASAVEYTDSKGVRPPLSLNECPPGYDTKLSDGEAPGLHLWGMWSNPSLSLLLGPHWLGVVVSDRVVYMGEIKLFNCVKINDWC